MLRAVTRMLHESPALHPKEKVIRALRKVSHSPLVFIFDEFVDKSLLESLQHRPTIGFGKADMLQLLRDISPAAEEPNPAQREFMELISCELFNGQLGANDALRVNCTKSTDPQNNSTASIASSYPEGLHVDTNNHAIFRSVTCILYLNDLAPECGGATIFPLAQSAETDTMLCASRALLGQRCMHTRTRQPVTMSEADAGVEARLQGVEARLQARLRSRDAACDAGGEVVRLPSDVVTDVEARHLQVTQTLTQTSLLLEGHMNDSALRIQVQSPLPPAVPLTSSPLMYSCLLSHSHSHSHSPLCNSPPIPALASTATRWQPTHLLLTHGGRRDRPEILAWRRAPPTASEPHQLRGRTGTCKGSPWGSRAERRAERLRGHREAHPHPLQRGRLREHAPMARWMRKSDL